MLTLQAFKKMLWHEQYKAANQLKQMMSTPDFTLLDLLDTGDDLITVAGSPKDNKFLVNYLAKPENISTLLEHVADEPVPTFTIPEGLYCQTPL